MSFENCMEWSSRNICRPQVTKNSGQNLPLRTDILQKTVVRCPETTLNCCDTGSEEHDPKNCLLL